MLSHYIIKVRDLNMFGNFVPVEILWYAKGISAPSPFIADRDEIFVAAPNLIERLLRISFASKIEAAKQKLTNRAERHLKKNRNLQLQLVASKRGG
jgi:hypothetical protein